MKVTEWRQRDMHLMALYRIFVDQCHMKSSRDFDCESSNRMDELLSIASFAE